MGRPDEATRTRHDHLCSAFFNIYGNKDSHRQKTTTVLSKNNKVCCERLDANTTFVSDFRGGTIRWSQRQMTTSALAAEEGTLRKNLYSERYSNVRGTTITRTEARVKMHH